MKEIIELLLIEDPNLKFEINEENGEFLLSGMGPLHLEVTADEIQKRGVKISLSEPRAVFKESCKRSSSTIFVVSPNGQNSLKLKIQRLDEKTAKFFLRGDYKSIRPVNKLKEVLKEKTSLSESEINHFWKCDDDLNLFIYQGAIGSGEFYKETILEIFEKIHLNGPLCGEKLTEVKIIVDEFIINSLNQETAFTELSAMFYEVLKKCLNEAELILLEPIYNTIIQLPPDDVKSTLSLLSKYSAKIKSVDQEKEYQATIEILIPVRNSIKFAEEIRSITSGRAFWQNEFYAFMEVPPSESKKIIENLRFVKGLSW